MILIQYLAQKEYKTRQGWVGKVISCELFKRPMLGHADEDHMHKSDPF